MTEKYIKNSFRKELLSWMMIKIIVEFKIVLIRTKVLANCKLLFKYIFIREYTCASKNQDERHMH